MGRVNQKRHRVLTNAVPLILNINEKVAGIDRYNQRPFFALLLDLLFILVRVI